MPVKIFLKSEGYCRCSSPAFDLRTIGTSIDVNGRFFMTEIRATQGFSLFFAQPKSTYINLLMWIQLQLRLYPDSIMFVPTQNP